MDTNLLRIFIALSAIPKGLAGITIGAVPELVGKEIITQLFPRTLLDRSLHVGSNSDVFAFDSASKGIQGKYSQFSCFDEKQNAINYFNKELEQNFNKEPCKVTTYGIDHFIFKQPDYLLGMGMKFPVYALISCVVCQSCEEVHYQRCMQQIIKFTSKDDLIFALTEQDLKQQCVQAQSALGCITRYIKKCVGLEDRKQYTDDVSGLQNLVTGLCSEESDLRSRYIQSLPCLQNASEGIRFCSEKFKRNQNDIHLVSYEDKTPLYCCSFDGYRRCLKMLLQLDEECQEGPSKVMDEIINRSAGVMGESTCEEYFEKCTGGGTVQILASASNIIFVIITLLTSTYIYSYL